MSRLRTLTITLAVPLSALLLLLGCGDATTEPPETVEPPRATSVALTPAQVRLTALDATAQLTAEVRDQNGRVMAGAAVGWSSSDVGVARVDGTGIVAAVGNGTATIAATAGSVTGTAAVVVEQEAVVLQLAPEALMFRALGDTLRLAAEAADASGHAVAVTWASSDSAVARVDAMGLVEAVGNGMSTITAAGGGRTASAAAVVEQEAVALQLAPEALTFRALGDTVRLAAKGADANGHPVGVTWASSDSAVARVDANGLVDATGNGSAMITATGGGRMAGTAVTVEQDPVALAGMADVDTLLWYGEPGDTLRLRAVAVDANHYPVEGFRVEWSSSLTSVATVDGDGLVRGRGEGATVVTATGGGLQTRTQLSVVNRDRAALTALYHATGGADWERNRHWLSVRLRDWEGATTELRADGVVTVVALNLEKNGLAGPIPPDIGNLASLTDLRLSGNQLTGPLPPEIGSLENLQVIRLWGSALTGPIPPEIGNLANLRDLRLHSNQLSGPIPPEIGNLENLQYLGLGSNALTGPIPPEIGNLENLDRYLGLGRNALTGPIPPEIGNLASLRSLHLHDNKLTGPIPPEIGNLASLTDLRLSDNQLSKSTGSPAVTGLSGPIPPEIGNLENLQVMSLWGNALTGPIPSEIGNLASLTDLRLYDNQLSGPIPPEIGNLKNLKDLNLGENALTGPIPSEIGNLASLTDLGLHYNQLTGPVPSEIGNLENLQDLNFWGNTLTGPIPPEVGNLTNLLGLVLGGNALTGPIPSEIGNLASLTDLLLYDNQLSGPIPPEIGNLEHLEDLYLSGNALTGPIPSEIGNLASLADLSLFDNQLSGPIPPEIGNLESLTSLVIHQNANLAGALPQTLVRTPLKSFRWYSTQLCSPPNEAFQQWLRSIANHCGGQPC